MLKCRRESAHMSTHPASSRERLVSDFMQSSDDLVWERSSAERRAFINRVVIPKLERLQALVRSKLGNDYSIEVEESRTRGFALSLVKGGRDIKIVPSAGFGEYHVYATTKSSWQLTATSSDFMLDEPLNFIGYWYYGSKGGDGGTRQFVDEVALADFFVQAGLSP